MTDEATEAMATFLLIHGAWHGGWCWEEVVPRLEARGHRALAPDLPGMGADRTPLAPDVLGQWTDAMAALVEAQPEPIVLVGHSRGGLLVSTLAERLPKRMRLAVYLCAFLLGDGERMLDAEARTDEVGAAVALDAAANRLTIDRAGAVAAFYGTAAPDVAQRAAARLADEPFQPFTVPLRLTAERFGRVPRAYVEAADDRALPLARQRAMQARWPCGRVVTLPGDHSPFYAMPERLSEVLVDLAAHPSGAIAAD